MNNVSTKISIVLANEEIFNQSTEYYNETLVQTEHVDRIIYLPKHCNYLKHQNISNLHNCRKCTGNNLDSTLNASHHDGGVLSDLCMHYGNKTNSRFNAIIATIGILIMDTIRK